MMAKKWRIGLSSQSRHASKARQANSDWTSFDCRRKSAGFEGHIHGYTFHDGN